MKNAIFKTTILWIAASILAACLPTESTPSANEKPPESLPEQTQSQIYHVLTDATYPPFEFRDERGEYVGLDIDLLNAIAKNQGFSVDYTHHAWDGIFDTLNNPNPNFDIIASAVAITEEATDNATLSNHYFTSPYSVVSLKENFIKGNNWQKKRIGVGINDDTQDDLTDEFDIAEAQFRPADTLYLAITDMVKGDNDVVVGDATVMKYRIKSPTFMEKGYVFYQKNIPSEDPETDKLTFAVKKGNTELVQKINAGLANLKKSGEFDQIMQKWRQD